MKIYVQSAVRPWKTKYEVHYVSPNGKDCLLGGSNTVDGANKIAISQADEIFTNPWETDDRKFKFLENLYIVDVESESDAMSIDTEDYIDNLMSELDSRIGNR